MKKAIHLPKLLDAMERDNGRRIGMFALLVLGVIEMLANGALSSAAATQFFFNAENCLYVRKRLRARIADDIMARGVQLHDLFEALPEREAQQEFQRELAAMRALCLRLLERHKLVA